MIEEAVSLSFVNPGLAARTRFGHVGLESVHHAERDQFVLATDEYNRGRRVRCYVMRGRELLVSIPHPLRAPTILRTVVEDRVEEHQGVGLGRYGQVILGIIQALSQP